MISFLFEIPFDFPSNYNKTLFTEHPPCAANSQGHKSQFLKALFIIVSQFMYIKHPSRTFPVTYVHILTLMSLMKNFNPLAAVHSDQSPSALKVHQYHYN